MVEKVFISPNRVRAYGNIVNMKTGDDFTLVNSELTVTTDMVDGAEMTVFSMECEPHISVSATNPYMLSGETTDVVVKLERGLGEPVPNKNVTIGQSVFIDEGTTTSHNDNWSLPQYMTRDDNGTTISNTGTGTLFEAVRMNNSNLGFANTSYVVEFEIVENPSSTNRFRFDGQTLCTGETYPQQDISFSRNETGKFRFVYNKANNTILKYKDGEYVSTYNHQFCGNMGFLFRLESGASIKIKDFIIYKTINGVTDEKGEFALHGVSVTDDTTFTATYGTVSDSVDVFLCTSVDYATSNKNTNMWTLSNFTLSRGDSYSTLTEGSSTGTCTSDSSHKIAPTQTISFDLCQMDGTKYYAPIYIRNDGGGTSLASITYSELNANVGDWVHMKIVFNNTSTITIYADTLDEPITKTLSATSTNYRLMFYGNNAITTLYFKNVAIY